MKKLDIFRKVSKDFSQTTNLGGTISAITVILISFLIYKEISSYMTLEYIGNIKLDELVTRGQMTINLDIEFPSFPCQIISLDLLDSLLIHKTNIGSVQKWRIDKNGNYLDNIPFQFDQQNKENEIFQLHLSIIKNAFNNHYGCRLIGSFTVKQVPGNFHVSWHSNSRYYIGGLAKNLNMSHIIHKLYFGTEHHLQKLKANHPDAEIHLLKEKTTILNDEYAVNYFIDIIPTDYHQNPVNKFHSYQYVYQENIYHNSQLKGVVHFNYKIGGLIVDISSQKQNFTLFLIHLCAIIGGTFTLCKTFYMIVIKFRQKFTFRRAPSAQMIQLQQ